MRPTDLLYWFCFFSDTRSQVFCIARGSCGCSHTRTQGFVFCRPARAFLGRPTVTCVLSLACKMAHGFLRDTSDSCLLTKLLIPAVISGDLVVNNRPGYCCPPRGISFRDLEFLSALVFLRALWVTQSGSHSNHLPAVFCTNDGYIGSVPPPFSWILLVALQFLFQWCMCLLINFVSYLMSSAPLPCTWPHVYHLYESCTTLMTVSPRMKLKFLWVIFILFFKNDMF